MAIERKIDELLDGTRVARNPRSLDVATIGLNVTEIRDKLANAKTNPVELADHPYFIMGECAAIAQGILNILPPHD